MLEILFNFVEKILAVTIDPFTFDYVTRIFDFILGK